MGTFHHTYGSYSLRFRPDWFAHFIIDVFTVTHRRRVSDRSLDHFYTTCIVTHQALSFLVFTTSLRLRKLKS